MTEPPTDDRPVLPDNILLPPDNPTSRPLTARDLVKRGQDALKAPIPNYQYAEKSFQSALYINPDEVVAHEGLGEVFAEQKKYAKAIAAYETVVSMKPKRAEAYYRLGLLFHKVGRADRAQEQVRVLRELKKEKLAAGLEFWLSRPPRQVPNR